MRFGLATGRATLIVGYRENKKPESGERQLPLPTALGSKN